MSYHSFSTKIAKKLGMVEAVLLHNIQFWIEKSKANNKHFYKGRYWTYNSAKAFSELFDYLSDRQISRALKALVDDGYLIKDNFNTGYKQNFKQYNNKLNKKEDSIYYKDEDGNEYWHGKLIPKNETTIEEQEELKKILSDIYEEE